jgi:hypothetical protein
MANKPATIRIKAVKGFSGKYYFFSPGDVGTILAKDARPLIAAGKAVSLEPEEPKVEMAILPGPPEIETATTPKKRRGRKPKPKN